MHSSLRTELRGTQRVFELLRPQITRQRAPAPRSFSSTRQLQKDKTDSSKNNRSEAPVNLGNFSPDRILPYFRPTRLASRIERWIDDLSKNGEPLHVWNTISQQDEHGKWKLTPQVREDLEEIDRWALNDHAKKGRPFGIKIKDGRIRALSASELYLEQCLSPGKDDFIHGPFMARHDENAEGSSVSPQRLELENLKFPGLGVDSRNLGFNIQNMNSEPVTTSETHSSGNMNLSSADTPSRYHGSAAARRQRSQRPREKSVAYILTQWFNNGNVFLWQHGEMTPQMPELNLPLQPNERLPRWFMKMASRRGLIAEESPTITESSNHPLQGNRSEGTDEQPRVETSPGSPNGKPGTDDPAPVPPSASSAIIWPPNDKGRRYWLRREQIRELVKTVEGKFRALSSGSSDVTPGGIRNHLIIHYAGPDADILLDTVVKDLSQRLNCDLVSLDAQDISSLILDSDIDPMLKHEAASLSYDVFKAIYQESSSEQRSFKSELSEEMEDLDDDDQPASRAMPFIVGKPIRIDLKELFSNRPHRRSGRTPSFISEMMTNASESSRASVSMATVVDSVLSSTQHKRRRSETEATGVDSDDKSANGIRNHKEPRIIQIKNLHDIQGTNLGQQFLRELYAQLERRVSTGEPIMLVGTECSQKENAPLDKGRIRDLQKGDPDEIFTTIVMTPTVFSRHDKMLALDRAQRIMTINARHLWQVLQSKNISLGPLQSGPWTRNLIDNLDESDQNSLAQRVWSFGFVQRLTAILASPEMSGVQRPIAEAVAILEESDKTKFSWVHPRKPGSTDDSSKDRSLTEWSPRDDDNNNRIAAIREKATRHEKKLLGGVIEAKNIATTFNDIHIPRETIDALQTLTTLSLIRPDAFRYGVLASDRIPGLLLYGPPGTGKTLAAKAVAKESGATMLEVSAADINDMYVGEGEKNVKALFGLARKLSPCIVFLDEADAMFSARSNQHQRSSHREIINQFLREWDGMSNDSGSAFLMVATNRPMDLDDAVLRRLPRRLLVDLPSEADRLEILKIHLRHEQLAENVDLTKLAADTPFYSGSDLKNVAVSAALNAVREENEAAKRGSDDEPYQYPDKRILKAVHFERALEEISASIAEDMSSLKAMKKFDEQYGDKKGRKRKSPKWGFKSTQEANQVLDTVKVRS